MTTIGVAIAVPEPWGSQLREYRTSLGDPSAEGIPTHITLMPPFEVAQRRLPDVEQHLADAASGRPPVDLHLRGTGTFRPVSPVVFISVVRGISSCEQLAMAVRRGPLATDLAFPYHPHVTIAHHLPEDVLDRAFEEMSGFDCRFVADHFLLYAHDRHEGWQPTRRFVLGEGGERVRVGGDHRRPVPTRHAGSGPGRHREGS